MSSATTETFRPADKTLETQSSLMLSRQRQAFRRAGAPVIGERREDIRRLRDAVRQQAPHVAAAISADFGNRSVQETMVADIWPVISSARHTLEHLTAWMKPKRVSVGLELLPGRARLLYQPVGVVGIISPWNYPFQLAIVPLLAALAAGNRIMLKPSELTPRTSEFLAEFLERLFPQEKVATILGGPDVGADFAALPFDHLFYTGSTAVGRRIMRAAAENLTPVTLELGGKSPCIIGDDGVLPATAQSVAFGKLLNAGQTCVAPDYALVPQGQREDFIDLIRQAVAKLYPSLRENADYTSIVNDRHYSRLTNLLDEARQRGVRVVEINPANETLPRAERKLAPCLLIDPPDDLAIMHEEIFGPVLPIRSYEGLDQAIEYVNSQPRPLALYYYGSREADRNKVLNRTASGGASVNETLMHIVVENLPFGGIGPSGMGAYHGEYGFQTFSHRKGVFLQSRINGAGILRPPYGKAANALLRFMLNR
jgi:coniferyl-aldehyde dehydrogenase